MVPGAFSPGGGTCPSPLTFVLVSEPRLPGLRERRPDFLWLAANSDTWFPVLVEIERPSKRLFRENGVPIAHFSQARNQLNQWRAWFGLPANLQKFCEDYGVPQEWARGKRMSLRMILIYGRRNEFERDATRTRERGSLLGREDEVLMSFDRLTPDPLLGDAVTARACGAGRYKAIRVPPTLRLGPNRAERLLSIDGLPEAIRLTPGWTPDRRSFVISRLPYWAAWARQRETGRWTDPVDQE